MSANKQYYFIRLKDHFFDSEEVVILESMPDGFLYSNILLKLYLRSLKTRGRLMVCDYIPYNSDMLSKITRHPVAVVEKALQLFINLGLVEILDNGAIYMLNIEEFIGKASTEADRKRKTRMLADEEKQRLRNNSGQMSGHLSGQISTIDITTNIDRNRDKKINNKTELENVDNSDDVVVRCVDSLAKLGFSVDEARGLIARYGVQRVQEVLAAADRPGIESPVGWIKAALAGGWSVSHHRPEGEPMEKKNYAEQQSVADALVELMRSRGECWSASDYATTGLLTDHTRNTMMSLSAAMSAAGVTPEDLR